MPTFGRAEMDFEPAPESVDSTVEFACTAEPEPSPEYEEALAQGVLRELAAANTERPDAWQGSQVRARVIVRSMAWHWVDRCEMTFDRLGTLAVREALSCVTEDRAPQLIETKVNLVYL
ncbi:hypothetical protein ACWGQL_35570 [Streptomyces lydicus]